MEKEPEEYEPLPKLPDKRIIIGGFTVLAIVAGIITFLPGYFQQREIEKITTEEEKTEILGVVVDIDHEEGSFTVEEETKSKYKLIVTENITVNIGDASYIISLNNLEIGRRIELRGVKLAPIGEGESAEVKEIEEVGDIILLFPK